MQIVHFGVGNFFRAHQAWYTHVAEQGSKANWSTIGISVRNSNMRDALKPQNYEYALEICNVMGRELQKVAVIKNILVAKESPEAVFAAIADPSTKIVSLTITEKGYCLNSDGRFDLNRSEIKAGFRDFSLLSAIGLICYGLAKRAPSGAPLTILSCDNLPGNGAILQHAVFDYVVASELNIAEYITDKVIFPSTVVDRITPATDDELRKRVDETEFPKNAPVTTEAYSSWIIEDSFASARPSWDAAGAIFTDDVAPYELRKLRMLNGAHSYIAYSGILAGYKYVHQAIADREIRKTAEAVMDEAIRTLAPEIRSNAFAFKKSLWGRFANPSLCHRLLQIAADGSVKLPVRILPIKSDREELGLRSPACDAVLSAWRQFLVSEISAGRPLEDPSADFLTKRIDEGCDAFDILEGLS